MRFDDLYTIQTEDPDRVSLDYEGSHVVPGPLHGVRAAELIVEGIGMMSKMTDVPR